MSLGGVPKRRIREWGQQKVWKRGNRCFAPPLRMGQALGMTPFFRGFFLFIPCHRIFSV